MDERAGRSGPPARKPGDGPAAQDGPGTAPGETAARDHHVHDRRDAAEGRGRSAAVQRRGGEVARVSGTEETEGNAQRAPVNDMDLEQLEFQISQHLDGTLPAAERAALLQRIESDPVARELFETHRRIDAELRTGLRTPAVNWDRLAEHLSARVAEADEAQAPAPTLKPTFVRRMMPFAIAAMVLIALGLAFKLFPIIDPT